MTRAAMGAEVASGARPVRFGVLGAARIAPMALVRPARAVDGVTVEAVAARDGRRAQAFARKHGIPRVADDYGSLLSDAAIDAVYIPLPNGLHARWTLAALAAGKHVLCEKPLTANAAEAEAVRAAAAGSSAVVMEAFHWRYHPLAARLVELVRGGDLGRPERFEVSMCIPLPSPGNIRYRLDLAGGATMDTGCYAVHCLRTLSGEEPTVVSATATSGWPAPAGVDRAMRASLTLPSGAEATLRCALWSSRLVDVRARVCFEGGAELRVLNYVVPQLYHRLAIRPRGAPRFRVETVPGEPTYTCQLRAFERAVRAAPDGAPLPTGPEDSVRNMRVIDAIYAAAGLPPRVGDDAPAHRS
ncbi:MAG: Gfo/Idh/MocA family oxidoreductase [Myxococcales bacterium]|nr:Gfo/Idh/MocA family oxidoreductase [Myxococcales bacterium]